MRAARLASAPRGRGFAVHWPGPPVPRRGWGPEPTPSLGAPRRWSESAGSFADDLVRDAVIGVDLGGVTESLIQFAEEVMPHFLDKEGPVAQAAE